MTLKNGIVLVLIVAATFIVGFATGVSSASGDLAAEAVSAEISRVAGCSIEKAHKELCWIPCSSDSDCLQKNGMTDR